MQRKWTRITLLLAAVCLTLAAVVPNAQAACPIFLQCTTEGDAMYRQDGCCNIGLFGPTIRERLYVCHDGCFQRTNTTQCLVDPCI
jgi:hypothetical protein